MRNKQVKVIFTAIALIAILILVIGIWQKSDSSQRKGLQEIFFASSDKVYAEKLIEKNGHKYTIDDYTITLEETLYDGTANIRYCVFSIVKEGGRPEIELNSSNQSVTGGFGKNGRFRMGKFASQESKYEVSGDVLYLYFSFRADEDFQGNVKIVDTENKNKKYEYRLSDMEEYNEYILDKQTNIFISPIGILINSESDIKGEVTLHYKDGKEKVAVNTEKEIGTGLSRVSKKDGKVRSLYTFKELQNIQNIDYILVNDNKIMNVK